MNSIQKPLLIATDLEGVLVPEVWIEFSKETGIEELKLTTRDIKDYDELMQYRLKHLSKHKLTIKAIQAVIQKIKPYPGAKEYLDNLRSQVQVIVLSDTFYEFSNPLMRQLDWPTIFCHSLLSDKEGNITGYRLRLPDGKKKAVKSFQDLGYRVVASGDSYNDTSMLAQAEEGILFKAPANVISDFPQYKVFTEYNDIYKYIFDNHIQVK